MEFLVGIWLQCVNDPNRCGCIVPVHGHYVASLGGRLGYGTQLRVRRHVELVVARLSTSQDRRSEHAVNY
jgi:hypothetical protein